MRGKLVCKTYSAVQSGITPADAGKTYLFFPKLKEPEDHPRGCGENNPANYEVAGGEGSPPRMRGKLNSLWISNSFVRITPADAGKTSLSASSIAITADHPRGCGENTS